MKKPLLQLLAIAILALTANLAVAQTYTFPVKGSQGFSMTHKTRDGARISYQLGQFSLSQIEYRGGEGWHATGHGVAKSQTHLVNEQQQQFIECLVYASN